MGMVFVDPAGVFLHKFAYVFEESLGHIDGSQAVSIVYRIGIIK